MNDLKPVYFSSFELFLPSPRLIFPFVFGQFLNYWISFSLFWVGFPNQHLLRSLIFFIKKTRVIKPLIIYIILKKINILIYREGALRCGFLIIKPQITLHYAVWCGAVHCYLRCCTVMPFCRRFWCGLCGLVSTPTQRGSFSKIEEDVRNSASFCDLLRLYQCRVHSAFNTSTSQLIVCHQKKKKTRFAQAQICKKKTQICQ